MTLEEAAQNYLDAVRASRRPYRQTASNAPSERQVEAERRQWLAEAEATLREVASE